jgi:hypothetical protein
MKIFGRHLKKIDCRFFARFLKRLADLVLLLGVHIRHFNLGGC